MSYCTNCGCQIEEGWKYCRRCGQTVSEERDLNQGYTSNYSSLYTATLKEKRPTKKSTFPAVLIILLIIGIFGIGALIYTAFNTSNTQNAQENNLSFVSSTPTPTPTPKPTTTPNAATPTLTPVSVYNGKIFKNPDYEGQCPLTVTTPSGKGGYYVVLQFLREAKNSTEPRVKKSNVTNPSKSDIAFYVSAGKSVDIDVPVGVYKFFYAYGETWYGTKNHFGENTIYYESDDLLTFYADSQYYNGHTIELWLQTNGNFDTDVISKSQFPS